MQRFTIYSVFILLSIAAQSQDLGNVKGQSPIQFSGSINTSLNFYQTTREFRSRDPFFWTISGSPTLSLYGVTAPFSFVISQKQQSIRQPFNQFGLSPYYKWLKLHFGYRSMSFSQYTLNGHIFNGVGAEATPGNWRLGVMYGRLLRAIEQDTVSTAAIQPTYKRKGYSFKVGYGSLSNFIDLIVFKGWDEPESISRPLDSASVNPQQNLALGIKTQQRLFNKVTFSLDFGLSGLTNNLFAEGPPREDIPLAGIIKNLLKVNYSTQFLKAGKASLSFRAGRINVKTQYQRIEPEYQTMGSYFFNNDLENITLSPSWSMFGRKMRVSGSVGWQRNNLFEDKSNQTNRQINSLQVSYAPSSKLSFSYSLTNYNINQRRINLVKRDVIDSLQLEQFSNNVSFSANYIFGSKIKRYSVNFSTSRQSFSQEQTNEALRNNDSGSISPSLSLRFNDKNKKWGWRAAVNYNDFQSDNINSTRWGVRLSTNMKLLDDKLSANASSAYNKTRLDEEKGGSTIRIGSRMSFSPAEKHSLGLGINFIKRNSSNERIKDFSEFLGNINYSYTF